MPTSAGRLRRSLGARQGVSVVMDSVESVKAASGARVRSRCASVFFALASLAALRVKKKSMTQILMQARQELDVTLCLATSVMLLNLHTCTTAYGIRQTAEVEG